METTSLAVFAIVLALGIVGVIGVNVVSVLLTIQEIDAAPPPMPVN
jgi:hypothetical protein